MLFALPALFNLGSLLCLFLFMFSIFGVSLYAELMLDEENLDNKGNFKSFDFAFLTLFRAATGEAWNAIMHGTMLTKSSPVFNCKDTST